MVDTYLSVAETDEEEDTHSLSCRDNSDCVSVLEVTRYQLCVHW